MRQLDILIRQCETAWTIIAICAIVFILTWYLI